MNPETTTLAQWVVVIVAGSGVTALGFLVRNAFNGTTEAVKELGTKLDAMGKDISRGDGDRRELARDVLNLEKRLDKLEAEVRDLSEGVAR